MVEAFENILRKIVVPAFDNIVDVQVTQMGLSDIFLVRYYVKEWGFSGPEAHEITTETVSMFQMLGPDKNGDVFIEYRKISE